MFMFYTDHAIDVTDIDKPFKPYLATFWTYALLDNPKMASLSWKWMDIVSDRGWILKDDTITSMPIFDNGREMNINDGVNFLLIDFELLNVRDIYNRKYKKVQGLFAEVISFINCYVMLAGLLIYFFIKNDYYQKFINNVFTLPKDEIEEKQILNSAQSKIILGKLRDPPNCKSILTTRTAREINKFQIDNSNISLKDIETYSQNLIKNFSP